MTFDAVVVTHNSAELIGGCIESILGRATVFVVDNASTDATVDIATKLGATVLGGQVNAGFASGCNRGAALGDAKVILFLNPDAVIDPESLSLLLGAFEDNPRLGAASPRLLDANGARQQVQWPYPTAAGAWRQAIGMHQRGREESRFGFVVGACFAVRREAFEAAGGFDERFWLYGEEADLCKRIEQLGFAVRRVPAATATHLGGASGADNHSGRNIIDEHFMRGGEHFVSKHGGPGALVSYRAANLVGSVARGGFGFGQHSSEHRRRLTRSVRVLFDHPGSVALDSPATRAPAKSLVVCSLEAWDETWRRNQFFVRELLGIDPDLRILFVEPAFDVAHERRRGSGRRHLRGLRPVDGDERIIRFEPVKWLPRKIGAQADQLRDEQVLDAVGRLGFADPTLWVNDPSCASLAVRVDWPAIYDVTDDWTKVADDAMAARVRDWERLLFERCEAITVCSPDLLASRSPARSDIVLVPNAVDLALMQTPQVRPDDLPKSKTVVYVGTLHTDRLDVDLTKRLASELDDVAVVLVGPDALDAPSRRELDAAGVIRLGPRPHAQIPAYLQHGDVIVVPHVVSAFTESLDPIKAYECLAVGTPTVATPVAGFRDASDPIHVSPATTFVATVGELLDNPPELAPRATATWSERAALFANALASTRTRVRDEQLRAEPRHELSGVVSTFQARRYSSKRTGARSLVINARFRQRSITGVERYATELVSRLPRDIPLLGPAPRLARPPLGHVWEQTGLPIEVGPNEMLWSPCNTGPARLHNHLVTIHDLSPLEHPEWFAPNYARWMSVLTRSMAKNAEHLLVPSEFTRERLIERCATPSDKITVIPNGVDASFCDGRIGLSSAERHAMGLPDGPYVLALATEEPRKNLARVHEAFALVHRDHPELHLVLAGGSGHAFIFASSTPDSTKSHHRTVRLGYVADEVIPRLYASAAVFVYAPLYEGFGIPPLEAAAAGTPTVLSAIPPLRELGLMASWADPSDSEAIADAISRQLAHPRREERSAVDLVRDFSWDHAALRVVDTLRSLGVSVR